MTNASALDRIRVLIVDDNQHMIHVVRTILKGFGVSRAVEARDAIEALQCLREQPIDVVIADYQMEVLDGTEFTRMVRNSKDSADPFVPIIMLTAHSEKSRVTAARDAGVTEFCCKPVTAADLFRKLGAVINTPRPFVRVTNYFGPDRRRNAAPNSAYKGANRRAERS